MIEQDTEPHARAREEGEESDAMVDAKRRRMIITPKQLQEHGYSPGCHRCSLHRQGLHARAKHARHNEGCRSRIYEAIRAQSRNLTSEEERRLAVKRKEPKPEDLPLAPETPREEEIAAPAAPEDDAMEEIGKWVIQVWVMIMLKTHQICIMKWTLI